MYVAALAEFDAPISLSPLISGVFLIIF